MSEWEQVAASDLKRRYIAERPKDVDGVFNQSTLYYKQRLLRTLSSLFELSGYPETWDIDYFWTVLYGRGYIGVTDTPLGVLPLRCGYKGLNVFQHPTGLVFANPILGSFDRTIDENAVLIKLQYNYRGAMDLVERYATMLAMCDSSLAVTLMNSKVAFIGLASNKQQSNSMKLMYDKISAGEPAVFVNTDIGNPANFWFNRVKENFVGEEILQVKRSITNEFLTQIGINNANTDKRERLNLAEVNTNNAEIGINVQDWQDNLQEGIDKTNAMFGLSLKLQKRSWEEEDGEEVEEDEPAESDTVSG